MSLSLLFHFKFVELNIMVSYFSQLQQFEELYFPPPTSPRLTIAVSFFLPFYFLANQCAILAPLLVPTSVVGHKPLLARLLGKGSSLDYQRSSFELCDALVVNIVSRQKRKLKKKNKEQLRLQSPLYYFRSTCPDFKSMLQTINFIFFK